MSSLSRLLPLAFGGAITLAVACGGGDSTGPSAASVTGIAGDNQVGVPGDQLGFPLSFIVLGSGGQPVSGVAVTWTVSPAGRATFTPPTSTSDASGSVSTTVRLGSVAGEMTISANVPGLQPVVFHALAVDPCLFALPVSVGATENATLTTSDCNRGGWYYDYYQMTLGTGQHNLRITMAAAFDTWIDFYHVVGTSGLFVAFDDDVERAVITNSQLDIIMPGDPYIIGANSYDPGATGAYSITVAARSESMNGCREVWMLRGVTVTDALATTDCADTAAAAGYFDVARMWLDAGTVLKLNLRSTAMNPRLTVYRLEPNYALTQVADNDDSSATPLNQNSHIAYTVATTAPYDIHIRSTGAGTGAYTLEVASSTTLSSAAIADPRGWRWRGVQPLAVPLLRPAKPLPGARRSH